MDKNIFNKLFQGQNDCSEPIVGIIKENEEYIAFNIKNPEFRHVFKTKDEFLLAIGSPAIRPSCFDDKTGEDIFWGR